MHWELIKLRKTSKKNQKEMAEMLGIDERTYSLKENGLSDFKLSEIFKIAKFFNKRIEEIFLPPDIRNTDKKYVEGRKEDATN